MAVVALLVMTFLALLVHLVPGDPAQAVLGRNATPERSVWCAPRCT